MSEQSAFQTKCEVCPLRQNDIFRALEHKELTFVSRFKTGELTVEAGATIVLEQNMSPHLYTLLDGWAFRHKSLPDSRRQILNFLLPGDLVGLQLAVLDEMDHTVTALTDTTLCVFQRDRIWSVFQDYPSLAFSLTWLAAREEQMLDGQVMSLGQRTAPERLAYLILNLHDRAESIGYARNASFDTPFDQTHLADALGISPVHLRRTMSHLEDRDLFEWNGKRITILDRKKLEAEACYTKDGIGQRPLI
ncbi:Crp/Fnr family transcriptional regulator [Rhodobacterales bacterium]|nr:Crp/Fnr family transcriptional regulator [Rhodobacterales bacterium]